MGDAEHNIQYPLPPVIAATRKALLAAISRVAPDVIAGLTNDILPLYKGLGLTELEISECDDIHDLGLPALEFSEWVSEWGSEWENIDEVTRGLLKKAGEKLPDIESIKPRISTPLGVSKLLLATKNQQAQIFLSKLEAWRDKHHLMLSSWKYFCDCHGSIRSAPLEDFLSILPHELQSVADAQQVVAPWLVNVVMASLFLWHNEPASIGLFSLVDCGPLFRIPSSSLDELHGNSPSRLVQFRLGTNPSYLTYCAWERDAKKGLRPRNREDTKFLSVMKENARELGMLSNPKQSIERDAEWFVRSRVLGESFEGILNRYCQGVDGATGLDRSDVQRACKEIARLLDF